MRVLSRLFGKLPESQQEFSDAVLGRLIYSREDRLWQASVDFDGVYIYFGIAGDNSPSPMLLTQARELAAAAPGFRVRLASFLNRESTEYFSNVPHHEMYQQEIAQLELQQLLLLFPDKPHQISAVLVGGTLGRWSVDMERDRFIALIGPE